MRFLICLILLILIGGLIYIGRSVGYLGEVMAAWVQAVLSASAILASVWLQDRERLLRARLEQKNRRFALHAIAERCAETLNRINLRDQKGLAKSDLNWLIEEAAADEKTVSDIDLTLLADRDTIHAISRLCQAMRRARRRLGYAKNRFENNTPQHQGEFETAYKDAMEVVAILAPRR